MQAGELAIGFGVRVSRTVDVAKIAKACGFDWLFIDMEHGAFDLETAAQMSVAALDAGVTPIVRVPGHEHYHATRVLDSGGMGIVVPHVDTPEQAHRVAENCRFPPLGRRSVAGVLPQLGYESMPTAEIMRRANEITLLVVMLETEEAIANADAIAATPGIDVVLIGTSDLSAEMGIAGQFTHARVEAAYAKTIAATRKHGKFAGMGGIYDHAIMSKYIGMGAQFILGGADLSFLMAGARDRAKFVRSLDAAAAKKGAAAS
ncbi:MAG: aldolase [Proteobacteria bacterium]|nr:aldolase [Pseudomonadota bacterium]